MHVAVPPRSRQAVALPAKSDSRWLGLLLADCGSLTLDDAQLALACLQSLPADDVDPIRETLRALVKRRHRLRGQ